MDEGLNDWFAREILPHEAALVRYLSRVWPIHNEVLDLRQEIYTRVYVAARTSRPTSPKAFLFVTARHLVTDLIRRGRIVSIEAYGEFDDSLVPVEERTPERQESARQELKLVARAFRRLSPKCREVVWLRRVDELSQKDVARHLGVSERTVESHLLRGVRIIADALFSRNADERSQKARSGRQEESDHG